MQLPPESLIQLISKYTDKASISAGYKLYDEKKVVSFNFNEETGQFSATILGNHKGLFYQTLVTLNKEKLVVQCSCTEEKDHLCPHLIASMIAFSQNNVPQKSYKNGKRYVIRNFELKKTFLWRYSTKSLDSKVTRLHEEADIAIIPGEGVFDVEIADVGEKYKLSLHKPKGLDQLVVHCSCTSKTKDICEHTLFTLYYLLQAKGRYAFEETYDWKPEKEKLLNKYGLSLSDDWKGKVEFTLVDGKPKIKILDPLFIQQTLLKKSQSQISGIEIKSMDLPERTKGLYAIGYVIKTMVNLNFDLLNLDMISGVFDQNTEKFIDHIHVLDLNPEKEDLTRFQNPEIFDIIEVKAFFTTNYFQTKIAKDYPDFYRLISPNSLIQFKVQSKDIPVYYLFLNHYLPLVQNLVGLLTGKPTFYPNSRYKKKYIKNVINEFELSSHRLSCCLEYSEKNNLLILNPCYFLDNKKIEGRFLKFINFWLVEFHSLTYTWNDPGSCIILILTLLQNKRELSFNRQTFPAFVEQFIAPYHLKLIGIDPDDLQIEDQVYEPVGKIRLSETGNFLLFYPTVKYGDGEILINRENDMYDYLPGSGYSKIRRNKIFEKEFKDFIVGLHKSFNPNTFLEYYSLHCDEALRRSWFIDFYHRSKEKGFEVYGFNNLKRFKYNPSRPVTSYWVSSGIDWFDLKVEVNFGDLQVQLADIRKSILKKENLVMLDDGSLGMLPDEWLDKWSDLLKYGTISEGQIRVSNMHYTIFDKFYDEIVDLKIKTELEEKKKLLVSFAQIEKVSPPVRLKATLRDYQQEGLNWLVFLTKFRWGGCLADDMGLGKTLQILALFCHLKGKNKNHKSMFLVVSPTTLIFNWQNEINKFCPHLKEFIHHGSGRQLNIGVFEKFDIILTSYSTLVNDIGYFKNFKFKCVVLDESQAIKNVNSLRFKAVNLLQADHRFVLTGTPIENNTLELYAQLHFVNPGLLGSFSFYKEEFFEAIDKGKDRNKASELIKLIRPFFIRRTKEEVAKDLPEKTDMILFCEMEDDQRKVYDAFRIEIRKRLLGKIDEVGIEKAKFNILEGLLKLRQICDSPALLNTEEDFGNSSAKCDELFRHIISKTGKHKILIFSQFLGMLDMIKESLDNEKINYVSLDGSTRDRKQVVEKFQQDQSCRVFVLSLKAGGYGLNLTEADYVYLVDPWWNPAVEEQAIDRTHRIGQKNKVFAYRMICKDTIEEKILELQQRKKELADEIISNENNFVKNLSREDLEVLLS